MYQMNITLLRYTVICLTCWEVVCPSPDKSKLEWKLHFLEWKLRSLEFNKNYYIRTSISAFYYHLFTLIWFCLSCKLQLIDLISVSATCLVGQQTILVRSFQRTVSVLKIKKNVAVDKSSVIFCTQFGAQNAWNGISELPDSVQNSLGKHAPRPRRLMGLVAPCSYSRLFSSSQLPTSNFIETPIILKQIKVKVWVENIKRGHVRFDYPNLEKK